MSNVHVITEADQGGMSMRFDRTRDRIDICMVDGVLHILNDNGLTQEGRKVLDQPAEGAD
jgi:hypothetical protein